MPAPTTTSEPAWTDPLLANPHAVQDKAARVNKMFSAIAPSYDLNNRLHSLGLDQHWRNVAVKMADVQPTDTIIDVACGTGDLTLKFADKLTMLGEIDNLSCHVTGIDFTYEMLPIAQRKWEQSPVVTEHAREPFHNANIRHIVNFLQGNALALPLPDKSADILSIAFGIRNVANWQAAIDEFARVLKPAGRLIILEFSLPTNPLLRAFYNFYFKKIMPHTATLISHDKTGAYKYLPQSVNTFISREDMQTKMKSAGFTNVLAKPLTCGICICYKGIRQ
ncbi:MAG: bifunctional demethylmenaquinone methyltransferase/2-methoxy-6-polyprenyl-1,4-benzoquinol methylase UbiE [Phycisphaerae bacterium]